MPHLTPLSTTKDDKPWRKRDAVRIPLKRAGIFHDRKRGMTHEFDNCEVEVRKSDQGLLDSDGDLLPNFRIKVWNDYSKVSMDIRSVSRARWTFDQPTRMGLVSHLTYNEYPFEVFRLEIEDEEGTRTLSDYDWIHGNAEHSWGFLH